MAYYSQPGIFNALDDWGSLGQGMISGDSTFLTAIHNAKALQATIDAAVASCSDDASYGAIVLIPSNSDVPQPVNPTGTPGTGGEYWIAVPDEADTTAISITCAYPLLIVGCGDATILHMVSPKNVFEIETTSGGDANIGGITFQDLQFVYDLEEATGGAAIATIGNGAQNVRIFRCVFRDVPNGVVMANTLQFSMLECTSVYDNITLGTMLSLTDVGPGSGCPQAFIAACRFAVNTEGTSVVGLSVGIADELRCIDSHFEGCQTAIQIMPGGATKDMTLENVVASGPGTQLLVQPASTQQVENLALVNCAFTNTDSASTDSAIVLDAGASNADIDTVRFVSCTCLLNPASGLEIRSGRHIEILGGSYSGNTQVTGSGAGIWLNGSPTDVRIVGVGLRADVYSSTAQQYAVIVGSGASNIFISDCDVTNYGTGGPLSVLSAGANNIQVLKCPGYNDQGTPVSTSPPPDNAVFNGFYFTNKYYGPVTFYTTGSGILTISVKGVATPLKSGSFRIAAGSTANAKIHYTGPPTFLMIGE